MGNRTPPFSNYPEWTVARFFGFLRSGMREKFNRYPPKYEALKRAMHIVVIGEYKTGPNKGKVKLAKHYKCAACEQLFMQKDVQVDHITPAGSFKSFDDAGPFLEKLFCSVDDLQVLCKPCHNIKTQEDRT